MKIIDIRPKPPGFGNTIAHFDVQTPWGMRLFNLKLVKSTHGYRVYSPSAFQSAVVTFTHELSDELIAAACVALEEVRHGKAAA